MARSVTGYVNTSLNGMASASSTGSQEPVTGLPIGTGNNVGLVQEFSDASALKYSAPGGRTLFSGTYMWVQLDPAVTGTVPVGSALFWLQTATGAVVTTVASGNNPDFAGVSIDPNFGAALPYAWIQCNGKCSVLLSAAGPSVFGSAINITAAASTFDAGAAQSTVVLVNNWVGYALAVISASQVGLARIVRAVTRF